MNSFKKVLSVTCLMVVIFPIYLFAQGFGDIFQDKAEGLFEAVLDVQKYERAIHIMAMLLVGFGFLMVFVRRYGRSALTATFLIVSLSIPLYYLLSHLTFLKSSEIPIEKIILAEFGAASLLIAAGAVLGRMKMYQYIIMSFLFIISYMFNEWIVLNGGTFLIPAGRVTDTGGSIVIHAFGAVFGLAASYFNTRKSDTDISIESDDSSERYSMLGSMVLWIFWPSFCSALVPPEQIPTTIINVLFALCGSTIATYLTTIIVRKQISIADIANAALAGGVAIGSACLYASPVSAIIIGIIAGTVSTLGFAVLQPFWQRQLKNVDTCGVFNLHGMPGILGGLAAIFIVPNLLAAVQILGIVITFVIALVSGSITGKIVSLFGDKKLMPYNDSVEFLEAQLD